MGVAVEMWQSAGGWARWELGAPLLAWDAGGTVDADTKAPGALGPAETPAGHSRARFPQPPPQPHRSRQKNLRELWVLTGEPLELLRHRRQQGAELDALAAFPPQQRLGRVVVGVERRVH